VISRRTYDVVFFFFDSPGSTIVYRMRQKINCEQGRIFLNAKFRINNFYFLGVSKNGV
jgi:hypothetical protein